MALSTTVTAAASSFGHGARLGRIVHLEDQVSDLLRGARVARHRVQRAGWLVERFSRLELAYRTVVDLHLIGALEHIAERVVAGMAMRRAAVARVALCYSHLHFAVEVGHHLLQHISGALSGLRLRGGWQQRRLSAPDEIRAECGADPGNGRYSDM